MPNGDFQTWVSGLQHMQTWATGLHHAQTWVTGLQNASVGVCERLRFRCAHAVCGLSSVRCPRRADRACTKRVGSTHLGQGASWALPRRPHFSEGSEKFFLFTVPTGYTVLRLTQRNHVSLLLPQLRISQISGAGRVFSYMPCHMRYAYRIYDVSIRQGAAISWQRPASCPAP